MEVLGPGSGAFLEFDFILMDFDDFYASNHVPFVDEFVADYGAGAFVTDEDAGYQPERPCGGA